MGSEAESRDEVHPERRILAIVQVQLFPTSRVGIFLEKEY